MNKSELVDSIAQSAGLTKEQAAKAVNAFTESVQGALQRGDDVVLVGFGTFSVKERAARMGRNPKPGEAIQLAASKVPSFKAGKVLKESVN